MAPYDPLRALSAGAREVYDALVADGTRPDIAASVVWKVPSHLSDEWRGLYVEIADARTRAVRLDDDRRHGGKPLYWRCAMPLCRHCGSGQ